MANDKETLCEHCKAPITQIWMHKKAKQNCWDGSYFPVAEPRIEGTFTCPICGLETSHTHSGAEIVAYRNRVKSQLKAEPVAEDRSAAEQKKSGITDAMIEQKFEELNADDGDIIVMAMLHELLLHRQEARRQSAAPELKGQESANAREFLQFLLSKRCVECKASRPLLLNSAGYYSHNEDGNYCLNNWLWKVWVDWADSITSPVEPVPSPAQPAILSISLDESAKGVGYIDVHRSERLVSLAEFSRDEWRENCYEWQKRAEYAEKKLAALKNDEPNAPPVAKAAQPYEEMICMHCPHKRRQHTIDEDRECEMCTCDGFEAEHPRIAPPVAKAAQP